MNLSPKPKTPIRTPQAGSSTKALQLTPIWEEVVKNNRLPPSVSQDSIFKEIGHRLEDLEWPVRQHAFRVLCDIIPVLSNDRLDEKIIENDILSKLVVNLGHPAPGVRKVASETIQKYLKQTAQTERILDDLIQYGMKEVDLINNDQAGIPRENITLGTISTLADVLKPFIKADNGNYALTQESLAKIVEALVSKMRNSNYRNECLMTLWKLREIAGTQRFFNAIDDLPERDLIIQMMNIYGEKDVSSVSLKTVDDWSDETNSCEEINDFLDLNIPEQTFKESSYIVSNESSEECTDGTDTDTYTKEPVPNDLDCDDGYCDEEAFHSFVPIDAPEEPQKEKLLPSNQRVLLQAEIQLPQNKAITMKVTEEDEDESLSMKTRFTTEDGDLIMKVLHNTNDIDADAEEREEEGKGEKTRTPKRVRFGGEVIKLRTPDSDTTDITIEITEAENKDSVGELLAIEEPPKEEIIEIKEDVPELKSQIPLPVMPATSVPRDGLSTSRRRDAIVGKNVKIDGPEVASKTENAESVPSSSGSETEIKDCWTDDGEANFWLWSKLQLVEDNIIKDLMNKNNWKIQYLALEQLKSVLINPKTTVKIGHIKYKEELNSLFRCLLLKVPESNSHQVVNLALSVVSQLVETLPGDVIRACVFVIVQGLCRYFGGSTNVNLKMESIQSLKMLFKILEPSSIMNVLISEQCLFSHISKLRENALLGIMYATMTFPSTYFDVDTILERVTESAVDSRRRVRHAALEAIAVLSQFCTSKALTDSVARVAEKLPTTPPMKAQFMAAVQARLSRRLLPSISCEGLVLYALQIPASRRFGNPMGPDVEWILSGTGSLSTGSAKSKTQLKAAKRLNVAAPAAPLSPNKWGPSERCPSPSGRFLGSTSNSKSVPAGENPWTAQKNRNESAGAGSNAEEREEIQMNPTSWKCDEQEENERKTDQNEYKEPLKNLRAEDITWALVPLAALKKMLLCRVVGYRPFVFATFKEESHPGKDKNQNVWGESFLENLSHGFGPLRLLYLKLQPTTDQLIFSRSSEDVRKFLSSYDGKKFSDSKCNKRDVTEVRLLTPTVLRDRNSDSCCQNGKRLPVKSESRSSNENPTRIPVLLNNQKNAQKNSRKSTSGHDSKKNSEANDEKFSANVKSSGDQIFTSANNSENEFSGFPAFLPSIHSIPAESGRCKHKSTSHNKITNVDEIKLQGSTNQISGLLADKPIDREIISIPHELHDLNVTENISIKEKFTEPQIESTTQNKVSDQVFCRNHQNNLPNGVASAPPVISTEPRVQTPSTSSSNSTDYGTLSGSEIRIRRLAADSSAVEVNGRLPFRSYSTCNSKQTEKKIHAVSKNKIGISGKTFPDTLKAFDRPKEGLDTCFSQLESQQWEVNMLGLTSLVRLLRHHPAVVLGHLHPIIVALGRQIRNLRSQVARAACQASAETFLILKRNVEPDLDELSGPLFHRSADTNRFIRADCNEALDNMIDSVSPVKAVSVIISKGATHQNATVRTVAARLLLRLSEKVGPEKLLSLPKEIRDKMLQTGANFLMEGKLETRAFAKQVFRVWSSHPSFSTLILEAIPPNIMRHINKTLMSLKS